MFDIEQFELGLWAAALDKANAEIKRLKMEVDADPLTILLNVQIEFKKLLDNNQGIEARTSPMFKAEVDRLHRMENRAKLRAKSYNTGKIMDSYNNALITKDMIENKYNNLKYMLDWKKERNQNIRDKMNVEKALKDSGVK
jgi:hypothetical protein